MSESTLEAAAVPEPKVPELPPQRRARIPAPIRRHPWWIGSACLVLFSFLLVRWAGTRPGYDPYGWMIWGYQTLHLNLDLGGAPSWKPLTWLFDVPFALFGRANLWLWMTTSVSIALAGSIFAGRLSYRLSRLAGVEHRNALVAGVFAGLCLLGIEDYFHYLLSVQSDPMIVTFCLAAIDCHLCGRYRWALALGVLASLGRPEAWPWVGLYGVWLWRKFPAHALAGRSRAAADPGALVRRADDHQRPSVRRRPARPALSAGAAPEQDHRHPAPLHRPDVPAGAAALAGDDRRGRGCAASWLLLILAGGAVGWLIVELAFVLHGWPGVPRYLFEPAGVMIVLGGVGIGLILQEAPKLRRYRVPSWAGILVVGLIVASLVPGAIARARKERKDLTHERAAHHGDRAAERHGQRGRRRGGDPRLRAPGDHGPVREHPRLVHEPQRWGGRPPAEVRAQAEDTRASSSSRCTAAGRCSRGTPPASQIAACASLKRSFIYSRHHPNGVLVHYIPAPFN